MSDNEDFMHKGILLRRTCYACPEQYVAIDGTGRRIGYVRLRHGALTVDCPDVGGKEVLYGEPRGDGLFEDDERKEWLEKCVLAIKAWKKARDAP